jgi:pyruvate,water dikinase
MKGEKYVLWFDELELDDHPQEGGKNAPLGETRRGPTAKGVSIPDGFAVTAHAYRYLLASSGIEKKIEQTLSGLDTHDMKNLSERGEKIRSLGYNAPLPDDLRDAIADAYRKLCDEYG